MTATAPKSLKFTNEQLDTLAREWNSTPDRIDPCTPTYKKLRAFVASLPNETIAQLVIARKIKWVSTLASCEARTRKLSRSDLETLSK